MKQKIIPIQPIGSTTVHAKRISGRFSRIKQWSQFALWLPFFTLPYLRWQGEQAILFDIDHSQFRFFGTTVFPDDLWGLSLILLFAAMMLFLVTNLVSRAWCGYFCFQTAWTDWFCWIEEKIEGSPNARRKLDAAPWSINKISKKLLKHSCWLLLSLLTGISFSIWFVDAYDYWARLLQADLPLVGWAVLMMFILGTYLLAGFLREQTCMWLCPYSRIQGVMVDNNTRMPSYDITRGEPRTQAKDQPQGDCIDCDLCVKVCPTGIDIRQGMQLGCITCGLCIDACDGVMDKLNKPRGLIRYASANELSGKPHQAWFKQPQLQLYLMLMILSVVGVVYNLNNLSPLTITVNPARHPLFVTMSDGSIQNQYELKIMNKTDQDLAVQITLEQGILGQQLISQQSTLLIPARKRRFHTVFIRAQRQQIPKPQTPVVFVARATGMEVKQASHFFGPETMGTTEETPRKLSQR